VRVREVGADQDIVSEGDRPNDCKVILEGFVCRYKLLPHGRRQIMSIQIPGDVVDLQGFLLGELDHSLGTLTPVKIGLIPHDLLLEATERYPRIARALWQSTLLDSAVFREWMVGIGRRSATQRIAHLVCEMFYRLRSVGLADNGSYELPLTQAEIADALGLSTVHVNRSLQALRRKKLLSFERGQVAILDWEGLKTAGEFESRYLHVGRDPERGEGRRQSQGGSPEAH
jgi:CRP-like cAMP-binding protein